MVERLTFVLTASPYAGETAATVLKLATAALDVGQRPAIFATADGAYGFVKGQKATDVFDVGAAAETFLARGGEVHL